MSTDTLERLDLEALITEVAPCDWQAGHQQSRTTCTEVAVGLVWQSCKPTIRFRACEVAVAWVAWAMSTPNLCRWCDRPVGECWRSVLI